MTNVCVFCVKCTETPCSGGLLMTNLQLELSIKAAFPSRKSGVYLADRDLRQAVFNTGLTNPTKLR